MDIRRGDARHQAGECRTAGAAQGDRIALTALGTRLLSPDPTLVGRWDRALLHAESVAQAAVAAARAGVRPEDATVVFNGCRAATVLLAAGRREPARSMIRKLSGAAGAKLLPPRLGPPVQSLAHEFAAWTGDVEFLEKYAVKLTGEPSGGWRGAIGDGEFAMIELVVRGVWGLEPCAMEDRLAITLRPLDGAGELALTGLRVGRTTLTLRYRCRPGQVILRCEVTRGPGLRVEAALGGSPGAAEVSVDEVTLGGGRAVFRASSEHEIVFGLAG